MKSGLCDINFNGLLKQSFVSHVWSNVKFMIFRKRFIPNDEKVNLIVYHYKKHKTNLK